MPKPIPSNSIANPSFKRDKGISCSPARAVTIAESSLSDIENHNADRRERKENNRNRRRAFSLITGCSRLGFMPWQKLASPVPAEVRAQLQRKMRMLVDESLGRGVADQLKYEGYNAVFAEDVGFKGKDDSTVVAYAWRERRMIWTHDADFLHDQVVPEHSNPGVVVLPGADGDQGAMITGLAVAIAVFGHGDWAHTKSTINAAGEITIRSRKVDTGAVTSTRYRMTKGEHAEKWVDD